TRFSRDWSSDVCSSDLHMYWQVGAAAFPRMAVDHLQRLRNLRHAADFGDDQVGHLLCSRAAEERNILFKVRAAGIVHTHAYAARSEERRVGKESRDKGQ